jgi:hypothetical protein
MVYPGRLRFVLLFFFRRDKRLFNWLFGALVLLTFHSNGSDFRGGLTYTAIIFIMKDGHSGPPSAGRKVAGVPVQVETSRAGGKNIHTLPLRSMDIYRV